MYHRNPTEMAAQFSVAYLALKEKKDIEKLIMLIKPMILSAKTDGISDRELIDIINSLGLREKFYPAKLKELRTKLTRVGEDDPASDTEKEEPGDGGHTHLLAATLSIQSSGAAL